MLKFKSQKSHDQQRRTYLLTFPSDLSEDRIVAWLRSIGGTLFSGPGRIFGMPSIVFETLGTSRGIEHRMLIPGPDAEYIVSQLRSLIPGVTVTPDSNRPTPSWSAGISVGMTHPLRQLRVNSTADVSASLLASIQSLASDEMVLTQWILSPAPQHKPPHKEEQVRSDDFRVMRALSGRLQAHSDEIADRRGKLDEQNLLSAGRIAAVAGTANRASHLVGRVQKSLAGMHGHSTRFKVRTLDRLDLQAVNSATTPLLFTGQFTLSETAAILAFPIDQPFVAGLPRGAARHLHATDDIPRDGRVLGLSNVPGQERPIALDYKNALSHMFIQGGTGSGKSALMANLMAQDLERGYGAIVIDVGNSDSHETLYSRALSVIPPHRVGDVINMDVSRSWTRPVGFNVLDQGNPRIVVDQITRLFERLYSETKGVWISRLLFHGLLTLAEAGEYTFADIIPLVQPTREQVAWSDQIRRQVKDAELRSFWQEWENLSQIERDRHSQPLMNRAWQLVSRPETRFVVGQSKSSFQMEDVLRNNKILLVSLAGVPEDASTLLGGLLMDALWNSAQRLTPDKPNFLWIDEAQLLRMPMNVNDMLARARKHRLGVTVATQYLDALAPEMQKGVLVNALSKVIFQAEGKDARTWQQELGRQYLGENDLVNLRRYEAVAKVSTERGVSAPVTIRTLPPVRSTGMDQKIIAMSDAVYGRSAEDVRAQMDARRQVEPTPKTKRPSVGVKEWGS